VNPVPAKWRKYLKLVEYGLADVRHLEDDIRRFVWENRAALVEEIGRDITARGRDGSSLYVVKLVPLSLVGQLPNIRVGSLADLPHLEHALASAPPSYAEVWYCRTSMDGNVLSVAGRLVCTPSMVPRAHTVEQVWRCSPRLIEDFGRGFPFAYLRAARPGWGWRYVTEQVYVPQEEPVCEAALAHEFRHSMGLLEERRERLECFLDHLATFGFRTFVVEYKIVGSRCDIIDWDTPADWRVIGDDVR
jgi:hypothetical protein